MLMTMKKTLESGILTFFLQGRIDTANAATIDNEIEATMTVLTEKPGTVVFDCAGLDFISSTAL